MKKKLIKLLENDSVEIIIKTRIPYMCRGTNEDYGMIDKISIGDHNVTGYNGLVTENISQELMNKIKSVLIEVLTNNQ